MSKNTNLYYESLLLERTKWESEIRKNLRGGVDFIESTKHIRDMYYENIDRIDAIIKTLNK